MGCFLSDFGVMERGDPMPPCQGQLVKVHLIPRQLLRREKLTWAIDDPATWVSGCGGLMGNAGHHGMLDSSKRLRIPPENLPRRTVEFCAEHGLTWYLEREYCYNPAPVGVFVAPGESVPMSVRYANGHCELAQMSTPRRLVGSSGRR